MTETAAEPACRERSRRDGDEPLLALDKLFVYYGNIAAVQDLSLEVHRGEIVTLIGSNGAGKSTTLRTISGLLRPRRGQVLFDGRRISGMAGHEVVKAGICHSPEGRRIFQRMSVSENLDLGAFLRKDNATGRCRPRERPDPLPGAPRTVAAKGGHDVRRRAADARGRAGIARQSQAAAARRAVHGPRSSARRRDLRNDREDPRPGRHRAAGRAERARCAAHRRLCLRARVRVTWRCRARPRTCSRTSR